MKERIQCIGLRGMSEGRWLAAWQGQQAVAELSGERTVVIPQVRQPGRAPRTSCAVTL